MSDDLKLLIGGQLVDGDSTMEVIEPATGRPFMSVPRGSGRQIEQAVAAAKAAQPAWAALPLDERRARLLTFADAIAANADRLARALVREQGKPLPEASFEIAATEAFVRHFTTIDLPIEVIQDDDVRRVEIHRKPLGVVCAIMPWNFPVLLAAFKFPAALLLGNSFILKPAPTTPVTSLMLGQLAKDIFPAGVFSVVTDLNDLGATLTDHPDVAKISFTGSSATGKKVMAAAASTLKRISLELGGNDASIVLDDVDVSIVAPKIFSKAFMNAGQVCIAVKRVYAHSSIYDALCDELAKLADAAIVGDGLQQGTQMGPVQNAEQFAKAKTFLDGARREGRIIAGGDVAEGEGYFIRPTIVRDIEDGAMLVDQEQFAPILPVIRFDDVDDAVRRTNSSDYGLGGSVWSADSERAYAVARQIDSGMVWVNEHLDFGPHIPFGGAKQSGIGTELSTDGMIEFSQTCVINISKQHVG
ncbi:MULTISPECIES: aldehyde dehydrogenase family protein [unclassified Sphingomonas]|uniref:aldehyde dehydrogenase family protein n=1 Tax=unclassified Sphingomonas TaxID=196159 RepID=UPI0006FD42A2|nr:MULTISPECIES: aldehyde dehydrogenase family protein [unclassified Sphingomonas]KQX23255.1 aldehyde dehydrogenase [Sphingomonas sp. Root1294]KQY68103.1 aldehyde dehydrogenase [Sphingomonas sp. Root50]KRB90994.1 aldehyde dehydrogenase [Sphingomonas sp. Root720]